MIEKQSNLLSPMSTPTVVRQTKEPEPTPAPTTPMQPTKRAAPQAPTTPLPVLGAKRKEFDDPEPPPPAKKKSRAPIKSRVPKPINYDPSDPSCPEVPGPVWIFFTTIRDILLNAPNRELPIHTIIEEFQKDREKLGLVYPPYRVENFVLMGLNFLQDPPNVSTPGQKDKPLDLPKPKTPVAKSRPKSSKTPETVSPSLTVVEGGTPLSPPTGNQGSLQTLLNAPQTEPASSATQPTPEIIPTAVPVVEEQSHSSAFVRYNANTQLWRWVGEVDEEIIREELDTLELLFYFAVTRKQVNNDHSLVNLVPVKHQKCSITIPESSIDEVELFRQQEYQRYLAPERSFTYSFRDSQVVVAPMKRGLGNQSQKPRDHFLLRNDRPPHISLLCLVRDAAARLPGGIGTRPDVAVLLRDSQYIVQEVSEAKLNSVVSGALDRLHVEQDPCVRYDGEQKLWIYLHRRRKEFNFGMIFCGYFFVIVFDY